MAAAKKAAAKPKAESAPSETSSKAGPDMRVITYLAPGEAPDTTRPDALLDPELEKARDEERKAIDAVKVEPRPEPTIDDELVKARDAQIKRETDRARKS